jgi:hypothetical protein
LRERAVDVPLRRLKVTMTTPLQTAITATMKIAAYIKASLFIAECPF